MILMTNFCFVCILLPLFLFSNADSVNSLENDSIKTNILPDFATILGPLNKNMGELLPLKTSFSLELVKNCYDGFIGSLPEPVNIFDVEQAFSFIVTKYHEAYPDKTLTTFSSQNLFASILQIFNHCFPTFSFSQSTELVPDKTPFKMALTIFSDLSLEQFIAVTSGTSPPIELPFNNEPIALFQAQPKTSTTSSSPIPEHLHSKLDPSCQLKSDKNPKTSPQLPTKFDWREKNVVTSVKNQGNCGGCYAFSAIAAFESAVRIKTNTSKVVDFSEQQPINCAKAYSNISGSGCKGGQSVIVFKYLEEVGTTTESRKPFTGNGEEPCTKHDQSDLKKVDGYCVRSKYRYGRPVETTESLSDAKIQEALVEIGPLYALIFTGREFQLYSSGVLEVQNCSTVINHAITLVGYDERSWIAKNSWSDRWGEKGYFRVARGQNMCGINSEIAWVLL